MKDAIIQELRDQVKDLQNTIKKNNRSINRYKTEKYNNKLKKFKELEDKIKELEYSQRIILSKNAPNIKKLERLLMDKDKQIMLSEAMRQHLSYNTGALYAELEEEREKYVKLKKLFKASLLREEELKYELGEKTHTGRIDIGCQFNLNHDTDYAIIKAWKCITHNETIPAYAVMKLTHLEELLLKRDILQDKQKAQDSREDNLKRINSKLKETIKGQAKKHKRERLEFNQSLGKLKLEYHQTQERYISFKAGFKRKLNDNTEHARRLIDTYETYIEQVKTLNEYQILDDYINAVCKNRTGKARNYNTNPPTYNNIHTFNGLKGIRKLTQELYGLTLPEFVRKYQELKRKRNMIAHPKTEVLNNPENKPENTEIIKNILNKV